MTRPEENAQIKKLNEKKEIDQQHVHLALQEFFIKKDAFESSLEGVALSDAERDRLLKAIDFGYYTNSTREMCKSCCDFQNVGRVAGFYVNLRRRIETGSYVPEIPEQQLESD